MSVCLSVCLSIYPFVCLSVCLSGVIIIKQITETLFRRQISSDLGLRQKWDGIPTCKDI